MLFRIILSAVLLFGTPAFSGISDPCSRLLSKLFFEPNHVVREADFLWLPSIPPVDFWIRPPTVLKKLKPGSLVTLLDLRSVGLSDATNRRDLLNGTTLVSNGSFENGLLQRVLKENLSNNNQIIAAEEGQSYFQLRVLTKEGKVLTESGLIMGRPDNVHAIFSKYFGHLISPNAATFEISFVVPVYEISAIASAGDHSGTYRGSFRSKEIKVLREVSDKLDISVVMKLIRPNGYHYEVTTIDGQFIALTAQAKAASDGTFQSK